MNINILPKSIVVMCAALAILNSPSFGNEPAQVPCQKHTYQKGYQKGGKVADIPPKPCFWHYCKPHDPPFLPVVQSIGVRTFQALTDANQVRLSVEKTESNQEVGNPGESNQGTSPTQKTGASVQKASYRGNDANALDLEEHFRRLEGRIDVLLEKLDRLQ
ncbi:MAG: hypothetical protein H6822_20730 [Planctomycetaceae bacterium]|nr:hypothetical protein [Planctomycetales bacterium]MCB9924617.1 hypothetical protein [Planctomycetaceae bacterium]